MIISSLLELAAVAFVIWGFCNEQKLIDFENKIIALWKDGTK